MNISAQKKWNTFYNGVPAQLQKVKQVKRVATAFNTNIDAVVKISGAKITELAKSFNMQEKDINAGVNKITNGKDVLRGIIKCFINGIAEEWLCDSDNTFDWLKENIGYNRLQMGGQGGIVANAMAVLGIENVYVHTASHPKMQSEQFLGLPNLQAVDDNGTLRPAYQIDRKNDPALVHWIIEFDVGDKLTLADKEFICPKSNRFIASYDSANIELKINADFLQKLNDTGFDYMILSGFHCLSSENNGEEKIKSIVPLIKKWKADNPQSVIHLEFASTQDKKIRKALMEYLAPLADSIGFNEREALDLLEVIDINEFNAVKNQKLDARILFDILLKIKEKCQTPRAQLHFFGMYLTIQNKGYKIAPEQNKRGMMLAATIAASKAGTGSINSFDELLWAHGKGVSDVGLKELYNLAQYLDRPQLYENGICDLSEYEVIAVPTILIDKPLTLVGMGDTISSVSLIGAL